MMKLLMSIAFLYLAFKGLQVAIHEFKQYIGQTVRDEIRKSDTSQ